MSHLASATQSSHAAAAPLSTDDSHGSRATHPGIAVVGFPSPTDTHDQSDAQLSGGAVGEPSPGQRNPDDHCPLAGVHPPEAKPFPSSIPDPLPVDALLLIYGDTLDDLEGIRIATENRVRSLIQVKGMEDSKEADRMAGLVDALKALEHGAELELKRAVRKHPLGPWIKSTVGVGEKQGARLLAVIGDPSTRQTVSQLWAYCGYHVIDGHAARRAKGAKANWSTVAKSRAFLIAESCIKQAHSPYRKVYDDARDKYADAIHPHDCPRCGPKGKPAAAGTPLSLGHQHARALRIVAKTVLRDLWIESRRVQAGNDTQIEHDAAGLNNEEET